MSRVKQFGRIGSKVFPEKTRKKLARNLESTRIKLSAEELLGVSLVLAAMAGVGALVVSIWLQYWILAALAVPAALVVFLFLSFIFPRFSADRRAANLDKVLPDALRQMASTLRAGVGVEAALEDVASSRYGDLSTEFQRVVKEVDKGRPLTDALLALSARSRSQLYKRAFSLIVEGIDRGAALASVLDSVSNDAREINFVQRERRSLTTQQVLFLFAVSLFAAPFIMGMTVGVSSIEALSVISGQGSQMFPIAIAYTAIQAFITSLAVGVVRYGKMSKGYGLAIPFAVVAVIVFLVAKMLVGAMAPSI